jgi:acyl-CoA synthetase (AMP-forming)/AMP-acid ligase II
MMQVKNNNNNFGKQNNNDCLPLIEPLKDGCEQSSVGDFSMNRASVTRQHRTLWVRLDRAGVIGVPIPGIELKLVPSGDRLEARVKGPHVMPGYWRSLELTAAAFDEDGFYRIGDAVRFADPSDPSDTSQGLVYDGRTSEDFKLTTGTWVRVGALRVGLLAAASPVYRRRATRATSISARR